MCGTLSPSARSYVIFSRSGWGGIESSGGGSYSRRRRFWYSCQWIGKGAFGICFLLGFALSNLTDMVGRKGKGCRRHFTLRDGAFGMHGSGPCGRARGIFKPFAYSPFNFKGLGREGGKGVIAAVSDSNIYRVERRSRGPVPNASKRQIRRRQLGFAGALIRQGDSSLSKQVMFGRLEVQARRPSGKVLGGLPPEKSRGLRGDPAQRQRTEMGRIRSCCQGRTGSDDCCDIGESDKDPAPVLCWTVNPRDASSCVCIPNFNLA